MKWLWEWNFISFYSIDKVDVICRIKGRINYIYVSMVGAVIRDAYVDLLDFHNATIPRRLPSPATSLLHKVIREPH